ncbi:hypothetical protein RI129_007849 [Pyrocoelia pectoralis]|uniref:Uncharacterized protein n=1 Tax=Pyrocoelia pectoralis TaxID=417401 RepID=A0AAN7VD37_9COLE
MLWVFHSPLFTVVATGVLIIRFPSVYAKENFQTLDVTKLSKLERGTELVLIESGYNEQKAYRLEDFFWTGSGDGSIDDSGDRGSTAHPATVYETKTVLSTVYVPTSTTYYNQTFSDTTTNCPYCDTTMTSDQDISPTPTFESYEDYTSDYVPDADRQFWLLTVLKTDGTNPTRQDLKNGLAKLYKTAFQRQQERHLGISARSKRAIHNPDKPVNVYIIKISKSPINGEEKVEVLYHVSVAGHPVAATTAAADMHLVSDEEVVNELGYPFIIKAEPYLKVSDPEYLSSTNHTWIFIGVALSILLILLLLVAFLTLAMNKRNRTPTQVPNKNEMFHQNVTIGQPNKAFIHSETDMKKPDQSPTYINFRAHSSNATLRSGVIVSRPTSTSSSSLSGSSLDISPLMSLNKKQSTPPKKLNVTRPKAALNKTAPIKSANVLVDSDSGSDTSGRNSKNATHCKILILA